MPTEFPDGVDNFAALTPGEDGSRRNVPVGGRTNTGFLNDLGDATEAIEAYLLTTGLGNAAALAAVREGDADLGDRKLFGSRRALSRRAIERFTVLYVGDSQGEGSGVDSFEERHLNQAMNILRRRYPTPGGTAGRGYIPAWFASSTMDPEAPVQSGTVNEVTTGGLGYRAAALTSTGPGKLTYSLVGTDARIWYLGINDGGKSEYRVDGGSWVEIDHDNNAGGGNYAEEVVDLALGSSGAHTLEIQWKAQGTGFSPTPIVSGVEEFDGDPTIGIEFIDACHGGYRLTDLDAKPYLITDWVQQSGAQLMIIGGGINDWNLSDPDNIDVAVDAATAALLTIIDAARDGDDDLEVLLTPSWKPRAALNTGDDEQWHLFVEAQYAIAADDPQTSVFDLARILPRPGGPGDTPEATGGMFDSPLAIHAEETGQIAIGSAIADLLSLPSGGAYGSAETFRTGTLGQVAGLPAATPASTDLVVVEDIGDGTLGKATIAALLALVIDAAPGALDTLNELAAALGDDANFASTVSTALAGKQPLDTDLTNLAALTSAADKAPHATGAGTWALHDETAFARTLLATANAAAALTALGVSSFIQTLVDDASAAAARATLAAMDAGPGYVSGDRAGPGFTTSNTRTVAQGNLFLVPYFVRSAATFDRILVEISTVGTASSVVRLGIWNHDVSTGKPGTLILDGGTASGLALAEVSATISQALPAGWVWLGVVGQTVTGAMAVRGYSNGGPGQTHLIPPAAISSGLVPPNALLVTGVTGALATLVGATFAGGQATGPQIQLRVA